MCVYKVFGVFWGNHSQDKQLYNQCRLHNGPDCSLFAQVKKLVFDRAICGGSRRSGIRLQTLAGTRPFQVSTLFLGGLAAGTWTEHHVRAVDFFQLGQVVQEPLLRRLKI